MRPPGGPSDGPGDAHPTALRLIDAVSLYLEALPIAAAVITRSAGDLPVVEAANRLFGQLADRTVPECDAAVPPADMLVRPGLAEEIELFLGCDAPERQFAWRDGDAISGRHFTARLARVPMLGDRNGRCLLTLLDRTAEVETARSLRSEMLHDSLTGLPNRVAFSEAIDALADQERPNIPEFAVLIIDLRRFSRVNESLGSVAGDELLITVARRLKSSLRPRDFLARIGGDEFGVLLARAKPHEARAAADRLASALQAPFQLCDVELRLDAAIGCAFGYPAVGSEDVVRHAQFASKQAKASSQVETYRPSDARLAYRRFALETDLRRAIDNGDLHLAFQPVIDLARSKVAGFEALARWSHPDHGEVAPNEFIPIAEEAGMIVPLGRWALEEALRTLAGWDRQCGTTLPLAMAVNVSSVQFAHDDISSEISRALCRHSLQGDRLSIELTESIIINDPAQATRTLHALKELRARIALDDFGTGYSSLAYLQRLPIDTLKIDRSFVTGMLGDRDSVAIVRAVLSLADALGMKATAEGVETFELAQTLNALGCRFAQGWHFARALPPAEALDYALARIA